MGVPIAVGLGAIYAVSIFEALSQRGSGYCDSLTGLIFVLLCGRLFQRKTYDRITFNRDYKVFPHCPSCANRGGLLNSHVCATALKRFSFAGTAGNVEWPAAVRIG